MPRKPRLHVPGAFYHVTLRGNHRQDIFFSAKDRQRLERILSEVIERFVARVHAYCWMTNHIHLLIQVSEKPLGATMQRIASQYARQLQKRFSTTGHLFERRYHAVMVDVDEYLLELLRYIHLNPVRARMVDKPGDYPWTSHHAYSGEKVVDWLTVDFALGLFHADRQLAHAAYARFINSALDGSRHAALPSPLTEVNSNDHRILGSDEFVARVESAAWRPRSRKSLDDLINDASERFSVTREDLIAAGRSRMKARVRAWVAHQAITLRVASLARVAQEFRRDESTLRESVERYFGRR